MHRRRRAVRGRRHPRWPEPRARPAWSSVAAGSGRRRGAGQAPGTSSSRAAPRTPRIGAMGRQPPCVPMEPAEGDPEIGRHPAHDGRARHGPGTSAPGAGVRAATGMSMVPHSSRRVRRTKVLHAPGPGRFWSTRPGGTPRGRRGWLSPQPSSRTYGTPSAAGVPMRRLASVVDAPASTTMVIRYGSDEKNSDGIWTPYACSVYPRLESAPNR